MKRKLEIIAVICLMTIFVQVSWGMNMSTPNYVVQNGKNGSSFENWQADQSQDTAWGSPEYARYSDSYRAFFSGTTGCTGEECANPGSPSISYSLKAIGFPFSIPSGATIRGIQVDVQRYQNSESGATIRDNSARVLKNGLRSAAGASLGEWNTSEGYVTYGSSTDLWGTTWTPADINNQAGFGFETSASCSGTIESKTCAGYINHIRATVYYNYTQYYALTAVVDAAGGPLNSSTTKVVVTSDWISGLANSSSTRVCLGYMCIEFGPGGEVNRVTFLLDFSINGTSEDTAYVDNRTSPGVYRPKEITNFFACVEDTSMSGSPVFGIIHAGSRLKYIRLDQGSSFVLRLSQEQSGNKFIIPVTGGGCNAIRSKFPIVLPLTPFVLPTNLLNIMEMIISYPFDISGDYEKTGKFQIVLEKNDTRIIGEIK